MRAALVTVVPMLVAAILVMAGGERMARREMERRTPADRERLLDLGDSLRTELSRLDTLYLGHLDRLARHALHDKADDAAAKAAEVAGVRLIRVFRERGRDLTLSPARDARRLPEIELEDRGRPFDPTTAILLEPALLGTLLPAEKSWAATPDPGTLLHFRQPEPDVLVVFLVDATEVRKLVTDHVQSWLPTPLTPLVEARERVLVEPPTGAALVSIGPARHGPAASVIPVRTLFGDWQIRAWDGIEISNHHDSVTLASASALALALTVSGSLLWHQQMQAMKLAGQRVSFVNRVSHELGTPLTNLSLNVDLAAEALACRPDETRRRLGLVTEEIERLSRLVANVLTFSRRERDLLKLKTARCIPDELVQRTLESFRPALGRRGIEIRMELNAAMPVILDPDALCQIAGNLLSNVEKYAAAGRWLWLGCQWQSGVLEVEVRDRGPGIPRKASRRVFRAFERVSDSASEGASGTGLGLSIARDLAGRMGGTLELLESSDGAAFRLTVPAPPALALVPSATDAA